MASLNKVILIGNVTRDPEMRFLPAGTAIAKLGLALNRQWTEKSGEKKEEVCFVDCTAFGKTAEIAGKYVHKGGQLAIEGRLKLDEWTDKQTGAKRSKLGVVIESLVLLGGKGSPVAQPSESAPAASETAAPEDSSTVPF